MGNIPQRLKEAIKNDELVLFIGSGLSRKLKNTAGNTLGGWKEMVSSMLSYLKDKEYITAKEQRFCLKLEPIKALQRLENKGIDREKIRDFLQGYFALGKENKFPLQEKLYSLSTKIITTNYDLAFEEAIEKLDKEKAYKGQNKKLSKLLADPVFLFKLHGCIEDINSMVLFPSDYRKLYNSKGQDAALALLVFKFLIFSKTFLFIGTGMDEHQIINFFEEIKEVRDSFNQIHYIITTDPLSIPTNFLTSIKINDYAEIPSYIDQLLDIKEKAKEEKNPEKKLLLEQLEASKKEKEALEKELDKEKDKNKRQALLLKRETNNHFRLGLKHHQAEEYLEAAEEYKTASELKPEYSEAYNNWGVALVKLAKTKSGNEAEELYKEAFEKYKLATTYKKDKQEAYNSWGNALCQLAETKSGNEAEKLYTEAFEKYKLATTYKKDKHEAYYNWGIALVELAETKSGNKAEELYTKAFEKYKLATTYKKDDHEAYYNWGNALSNLAKTKSGNEAEKLYKEAFEKYNLAIKHGGESYNLACLYAIRNQKAEALKYLEQTLSRNEITVEFVEQDEDWKELRNDPDFQDLLSRYKK